MDVATRAYRDVLAASPGSQYPPWLPTDRLSGTAVGRMHLITDMFLAPLKVNMFYQETASLLMSPVLIQKHAPADQIYESL